MVIRYLIWLSFFAPIFVAAQTFTEVPVDGVPGLEYADIAWADYNNDGYLDFAISGISVNGFFSGIYTGSGDGTFNLLPDNPMPAMRSPDIEWGDFDNDGDLDLAMIGGIDRSPWELTVIMRNNISAFEQYFVTNGSEGGSLTWFDYDNDRDLDLYQVGAFFDNWFPNSVFVNTDGNFSNETAFHVKGYMSELAIDNTICVATDYDRDGDQDIFSAGKYSYGTWNEATLLTNFGVNDIVNTSDYRFSYHNLAVRGGSIAEGDFNKDGYMDYVITGNNTSIANYDMPFSQILFGNGTGNFTRGGNILDVQNSSTDVGDIDNDGDLDLLISGNADGGPVTKIYLNNGTGNFSDSGVSGLVGLDLCAATLADYDSDGDLDILLAGRNVDHQKTTRLYQNNLVARNKAPNETPTAPLNLTFKIENNGVTFSWDKANDRETPAGSLTYNVYVAIAPKTPFKLYPQAIIGSGKRKVFKPGNASTNTQWTLKDLKTGTYYFSVQSIDGSNAGSAFAPESSFKYLRIDKEGFTCPNGEQTFWVSPEGHYTWTVTGGIILEGQGSESIRVKWDGLPSNAKIKVEQDGVSNSLIPEVQQLPQASFTGPAVVCELYNWVEYRADVFQQDVTYQWNTNGAVAIYPNIKWTSPGQKQLTLTATDAVTGCSNTSALDVIVFERMPINILMENGIYFSEHHDPTFGYKWELSSGIGWIEVSTSEQLHPVVTGYYRVTITTEYGCVYSESFFVDQIVMGMEDPINGLELVPNPATSTFRVSNLPTPGKQVNISIKDLTGRIVHFESTFHDSIDVNCSALTKGVYIVCAEGEGIVKYSKVAIH
jgi:hypothetical protein